jgi:hypothetical protein
VAEDLLKDGTTSGISNAYLLTQVKNTTATYTVVEVLQFVMVIVCMQCEEGNKTTIWSKR